MFSETESLNLDAGAGVVRSGRIPWIETRPGLPYFVTEQGDAWTPIGHNDAVSWPELNGLFRRRDVPAVERHLRSLKGQGVTCLRLMLEYAQGQHRYIERPVGRFVPNMIAFWDDLFALCEQIGLHILLTPFDTFFTWIRWRHHPYNRANGGPCSSRRQLLTCPATRDAIKARLEFATRRWGGSPALFAWDLWNEMHPAHGGDNLAAITPFINDISVFLRELEQQVHGRTHLQTVSVFGPELIKAPALCEPIFRHPSLDFANTHLYEHGTIDDPKDTVAPAIAAGRLMAAAVNDADDGRPVFDSEHGPIHAFKDRHAMLPEAFDDEYFRHIQWAHLASGGAGGGMRWPNRNPHVLTQGMRAAQKRLGDFLPLIDWTRFRRRNLDGAMLAPPNVAAFGCADDAQAVLWLLRSDIIGSDGQLRCDASSVTIDVTVPGLAPGTYMATAFDTRSGVAERLATVTHDGGAAMVISVDVAADLALAVRRVDSASAI
jgi:hypothetical protein